MARTVVIARRVLPGGTTLIAEALVPLNVTTASLIIDRTTWATGTINFGFQLSLDNGATWVDWGRAGAESGVVTNKNGVAIESAITIILPESSNSSRRIRGDLVVVGSPLVEVSVDLS